MTKLKIKSWLSRNFPILLFWFGSIVVVLSLIFAPFSRRSISADAASSVDSGSYYFSGFPGIHGYSDLGDVPVDVELEFGLWTPFACSSAGSYAVWLPYGFTYTRLGLISSNYTFYYDGGVVAVASSNPSFKASHGSGFYRYSGSIDSPSFGTSYSWQGVDHYLTAYPQSSAVARSMSSLPSDPASTSFPCYVYASPSLILDLSFTVGHSYTFQINVCLDDNFSDSELLFAGRDMVWNGSYFVSTSPLTWYRPNFIPDSLSSSSSSYPLSVVVTPTSFFDATDEKYIYPFEELEPSVPIPPSPPDAGYDAGYADGYDAGQKAGFDSGYDSGYSEGFNKGQTQQLINPASSFLLPVQSFLSTKLFGTFSLGDALSVVMFVLVATIFIKMFAGG